MSEETGSRSAPKDLRGAPRPPERRATGDLPEIYEFGPFRLELAERQLVRGNEVVALTPKVLDTLHLLVRNSGHLLEKDLLIRMLWPDSFVEEGNLTNNIFLLRKALGQDPEYIETVPKKGYRFVGAVRRLPTAELARPERSASHRDPTALPHVVMPAPAPTGGKPETSEEATSSGAAAIAPAHRRRLPAMALIAALTGAALFGGVYALWQKRPGASVTSIDVELPSKSGIAEKVAPDTTAFFDPPPHSIAVLPFVNLSGDKEQEYFSDGLTEELLNAIAHIDGLQVAARTSSFSFREHPDIAEVARKLNVAAVLEGSVRRSGRTVRVRADLINAATGFHLWSKTYDRDLADVLKMQTEIATAVAVALEVTLLGDVSTMIELGGTRNPAALDAYLQASRVAFAPDLKGVEAAIAGYTEAIRLDPDFALAFAWRSMEWTDHAEETSGGYAKGAALGEDDRRALADAHQAVTLAPDLAEGHVALAFIFQDRTLDFAATKVELERAIALAPGSALVLGWFGRFAVMSGRTDAGIAAVRRAVALDPLGFMSHYRLGQSLYRARRYADAVVAFSDVLALNPQHPDSAALRGLAYYGLNDFQNARASCAATPDNDARQWCLALTYERLARHDDAEAALAKLRAATGDRWAYRCATIYAQWGHRSQALESLESAWRLRVQELRWLKVDPLMDPLRKEPRFQAVERRLRFPG
jgi:TolB-like protein/DNA-binding winged helix-turn-helix (wHTH) protein